MSGGRLTVSYWSYQEADSSASETDHNSAGKGPISSRGHGELIRTVGARPRGWIATEARSTWSWFRARVASSSDLGGPVTVATVRVYQRRREERCSDLMVISVTRNSGCSSGFPFMKVSWQVAGERARPSGSLRTCIMHQS